MFSVEIIADVCVVVLLLDLNDHGAVRLYGLLKNLIPGAAFIKAVLEVLDLLLYKLRGIVASQVLLELKIQCLTQAGRFYSFHFYPPNYCIFLIDTNILALFMWLFKGRIY